MTDRASREGPFRVVKSVNHELRYVLFVGDLALDEFQGEETAKAVSVDANAAIFHWLEANGWAGPEQMKEMETLYSARCSGHVGEIGALKSSLDQAEKDRDAYREAEKRTSDAYLRIREILGAWDTKDGGEDRFEVTEAKAKALRSEAERYRDLLALILPMAKGYAYANQVGSNMKYIEAAEKALSGGGSVP